MRCNKIIKRTTKFANALIENVHNVNGCVCTCLMRKTECIRSLPFCCVLCAVPSMNSNVKNTFAIRLYKRAILINVLPSICCCCCAAMKFGNISMYYIRIRQSSRYGAVLYFGEFALQSCCCEQTSVSQHTVDDGKENGMRRQDVNRLLLSYASCPIFFFKLKIFLSLSTFSSLSFCTSDVEGNVEIRAVQWRPYCIPSFAHLCNANNNKLNAKMGKYAKTKAFPLLPPLPPTLLSCRHDSMHTICSIIFSSRATQLTATESHSLNVKSDENQMKYGITLVTVQLLQLLRRLQQPSNCKLLPSFYGADYTY